MAASACSAAAGRHHSCLRQVCGPGRWGKPPDLGLGRLLASAARLLHEPHGAGRRRGGPVDPPAARRDARRAEAPCKRWK